MPETTWIYAVIYHVPYEFDEIVGLFSTPEKAEACAAAHPEIGRRKRRIDAYTGLPFWGGHGGSDCVAVERYLLDDDG